MLKVKSNLAHISPASFYGKRINKADQDQTPQNGGSDQGIQYLLTSNKIKKKTKQNKTL